MNLLTAIAASRNRHQPSTLLDGMVGYWSGNEASGNMADSHSGSRTLTANNSPTATTGLVYANTRDLEASSSQYFSRTSESALQFSTAFTIGAWCRIEAKPGGAAMAIASKWDAAATQEYLLYWKLSTDRFSLIAADSGGTTGIDANNLGSPSLETWYCVIGWYDGSNLNIQVNGGSIDTEPYVETLNNGAANFAVGANYNSSPAAFWDGELGPIAVWNRALTTDERAEFYNSGAGVTYAALL